MPMSSAEGKSWINERVGLLAAAGPRSAVDLGLGVGTYAKLLAVLDLTRVPGPLSGGAKRIGVRRIKCPQIMPTIGR